MVLIIIIITNQFVQLYIITVLLQYLPRPYAGAWR